MNPLSHQTNSRPPLGCMESLITMEILHKAHLCLMVSYQCAGVVKLTHTQLEIHRCLLSTVATHTLVLKHQTISACSAD